MKPAPFRYERPRTVAEAAALLASEANAKVLAGGQSLVPLLNMRLASPDLLVDVNDIDAMKGVRKEDGHLVIGALTRHRELETDPLLKEEAPLLPEAARLIGHEAIRTRGTIGGSVVHADPAAEWPLVLHALEAELTLVSTTGRREVPIDAFFFGYMLTAIEVDELLYEIRIPGRGKREGSAITEFTRRDGDFAVVAAAARIRLDEGGRVAHARLSLGGVGPGPVRAVAVEEALRGAGDEGAVAAAAAFAGEDIEPEDDVHASGTFRRHLARVLAEDALRSAYGRALAEGRRA